MALALGAATRGNGNEPEYYERTIQTGGNNVNNYYIVTLSSPGAALLFCPNQGRFTVDAAACML